MSNEIPKEISDSNVIELTKVTKSILDIQKKLKNNKKVFISVIHKDYVLHYTEDGSSYSYDDSQFQEKQVLGIEQVLARTHYGGIHKIFVADNNEGKEPKPEKKIELGDDYYFKINDNQETNVKQKLLKVSFTPPAGITESSIVNIIESSRIGSLITLKSNIDKSSTIDKGSTIDKNLGRYLRSDNLNHVISGKYSFGGRYNNEYKIKKDDNNTITFEKKGEKDRPVQEYFFLLADPSEHKTEETTGGAQRTFNKKKTKKVSKKRSRKNRRRSKKRSRKNRRRTKHRR